MSVFVPNWPLPKNVKALCTERRGGVSPAPYKSFNLATHVGDDIEHVLQNRALLTKQGNLPAEPVWLEQKHTDIALELKNQQIFKSTPIADASWTSQKGHVCLVMTADCLPVLLADKHGTCVAAVHAGWKGLADNIITKTVKALPVKTHDLSAWIGPAISQEKFEVGQDVYDAFCQQTPLNQKYFKAKQETGKYLADLPAMAQQELNDLGVLDVHLSGLCTYTDKERFYSYRRENQTGRIASMIWLEQ